MLASLPNNCCLLFREDELNLFKAALLIVSDSFVALLEAIVSLAYKLLAFLVIEESF